MPRKTLEVTVEPKVLVWARESVGTDIHKVAKRLSVSVDTVAKWELGEKKPTLRALKELARFYKRPLAVFFLPEPPKELPRPKDFRVLPEQERGKLSKETRLGLRNARRLQSLAVELTKSIDREVTINIGKANLTDNPETVAIRERERLSKEIQEQLDWKNSRQALNQWKKKIENLGILVFQFAMPVEEVRGFSLTEGGLPIIVLNLRDSVNARIFTLFHEYAHLLLGTSGICNLEEGSELPLGIEEFCNHFAGAVLVPKKHLLHHELLKSIRPYSEIPDEYLDRIATSFKVSQEVVLRRMEILELVTKDFYQRRREEWKVKVEKEKIRKKGFFVQPAKKCLLEKGLPFVSLVLETHKRGVITYNDVVDYLSIRLKHLNKIEQLIKGES
nr:ImmA/IrrE family metallo-endopeptidase [Desulfobacterales bacterium]